MALCCLEPLRLAFQGIVAKRNQAKQYHNTLRLPFVTSVTEVNRVSVRVMTDAQLTATFFMMEEAGRLGQGYGINEFGTLDDFRQEFKAAYKIAISMETDGEHVASLMLTRSRYSRGVNVADPYIIVKASHRGQGLGSLCVDLGEHFSRLLGYLGLYIDTFSNNSALIGQIERREGYVIVGSLPAGGLMPDGTVIPSLVYYKDLRLEDKGEGEEVVRDFNGKEFKRKRKKKDIEGP